MRRELFQRWDWENDRGVNRIEEGANLPDAFAVAKYDWRNRLFRVELHKVHRPRSPELVLKEKQCSILVYDYFCDVSGRVLQKRSLTEGGETFLIVDIQYDDKSMTATETAWWPENGSIQSRSRPM